jgi:hypothetical protein
MLFLFYLGYDSLRVRDGTLAFLKKLGAHFDGKYFWD